MFARASSVFVLALPVFAAASILPRTADGPSNKCDPGVIRCCAYVVTATDPAATYFLDLIGVSVGSDTGLVGISCSPLSILGDGGNSCSAQPVCCTNDSFGGIVTLGCSPISLDY